MRCSDFYVKVVIIAKKVSKLCRIKEINMKYLEFLLKVCKVLKKIAIVTDYEI